MVHKYSLTIAQASYFTSGFVMVRNACEWMCRWRQTGA